MIAYIQGEVLEINQDNAVINLNGLGLRVYVPGPVKQALRIGEVATLHTHLVVHEDAWTLYGFDTRETRDFYLVLLGVDGIGPRTALAVLSTLSLDAIRQAVTRGQLETFCQVPGIGRKTAQKMMLHLEDKVGGIQTSAVSRPIRDGDAEILAALTSLGYSIVESQAAVQSIPADTPDDLESRLKAALTYFS
jgi:Holliday junction DNA helicase RuvA